MTLANIIFSIIIMPLKIFFETIFKLTNNIVENPGISIIVLSLAINILVLPLYKRADAMQEAERETEKKLRGGIDHIKKTFKGDERMMILQTYYRQNHYKPTDVFKGSISLLLEIPFFVAAYQFLSHLTLLQGVSFGPISDLGAQDALIQIGNISINALPLIMTGVNLISCAIFTRGYPAKTKMQLYGMALFFLFFLYSSPAGLVFYWTLNNIFSLGKTIVYKITGYVGSSKVDYGDTKSEYKKQFIIANVAIIVLVGIVIPSNVILASPQEFVDVINYMNPLWYICSSLCISVGFYGLWMGVFYWLAGNKGKRFFSYGSVLYFVIAIVNYMVFSKNFGNLSSTLLYEEEFKYGRRLQTLNIVVIATLILVLLPFIKRMVKQVNIILAVAMISLTALSIYNAFSISTKTSIDRIQKDTQDAPSFTLSRSGKNVVVLMLDRGMSTLIPYILGEKPELKEAFSGFTFYENTMSYGLITYYGASALYGGYEYTPEEMNKRNTELLVDKHNEALKVMPVIFDENGYDVTVCDPTYASYQWIPDLSIYDEYPEINTYITNGRFIDSEEGQKSNMRNFFCYSLMKTLPLSLQGIAYGDGSYNESENKTYQIIDNEHKANGYNTSFMKAYTVLDNLDKLTNIAEDGSNNFLMMSNDTTHEHCLLDEATYEPAESVDNTAFDENNEARFTVNGSSIPFEGTDRYAHYQVNMAAMLKVADWLNFLKANGVYDNTRIIIVSDHSRPLRQLQELIFDDGSNSVYDGEGYIPLLLVKDFGDSEFQVSDEFMTNADVPTIATSGLIDDPINPFTGKAINNEEKYNHDQHILGSLEGSIENNDKTTYGDGVWFAVKDNVRLRSNWTIIDNP